MGLNYSPKERSTLILKWRLTFQKVKNFCLLFDLEKDVSTDAERIEKNKANTFKKKTHTLWSFVKIRLGFNLKWHVNCEVSYDFGSLLLKKTFKIRPQEPIRMLKIPSFLLRALF